MADYTNKDTVAALSEPNKEFADFIAAHPIPKGDFSNPHKMRAERAKNAPDLGPAPTGVTESRHSIPMRDGHQSELKIHRPSSAGSSHPLVVLAFGGGFVVGSNDQLTPYARSLVQLYDAVVVNISYRLSPENPWPASQHDTWDSLAWLAENASSDVIGADPSKGFVLGGVSAGGNVTAVCAQMSLKKGHELKYPLTGVWACIPVVVPDASVLPEEERELWFSRTQNAKVPILDADSMEAIGKLTKADPKSEWYSPFNAEKPFVGMPRTYVQVDGMDPLRDDGLIYERCLKKAGVETKLTVWPGLPHGHFAFMPFLEASKKAIFDTIMGFSWLLKKEVSEQDVVKVLTPPAGA
ncbi:hypothetical protein MBLNU457_5270t1 [Dothideomycetes sp. NU457]